MLFGGFVVCGCGFFCGFGVFFAIDTVHPFDYHEDDPGNNEKLNNILDEITIGNYCFVTATEEIRYANSESSKIYASSKQSDDRHYDVVY